MGQGAIFIYKERTTDVGSPFSCLYVQAYMCVRVFLSQYKDSTSVLNIKIKNLFCGFVYYTYLCITIIKEMDMRSTFDIVLIILAVIVFLFCIWAICTLCLSQPQGLLVLIVVIVAILIVAFFSFIN